MRQIGISQLVIQGARIDVSALARTYPAPFRQYHRNGLGRHQFRFIHGNRCAPLDQLTASRISKLACILHQFLLDERLESRSGFQDSLKLRPLGSKLLLLVPDPGFLELGQIAQARIQNGLCLFIAQAEGADQACLGILLFTNDPDDLVKVQIREQQPFPGCAAGR